MATAAASTTANISSERFPHNLPPGWFKHLAAEADKPYFKALSAYLKNEYQKKRRIFPTRERVLRALQLVDYDDVKVVILGQDPYHGPEQAIGLCFAVPNDLRVKPPSLLNIFKEMETDTPAFKWDRKSSELTGWAEQGVLLLNTVLTVEANKAFSHRNQGWETFTDEIIRKLNERKEPMVFILWGAAAQAKKALIDRKKHTVIESAHPSPLSASKGFFGSRPFSKTNAALKKMGLSPIDWSKINADDTARS